jgi:hypothetical protein
MRFGGALVIQVAADRVPPFRSVQWTVRNGLRPARIAIRTGPGMPGSIRPHPDRRMPQVRHRDPAP